MTDETKLSGEARAAFFNTTNNATLSNPWTALDVDKPEVEDIEEFREHRRRLKELLQ